MAKGIPTHATILGGTRCFRSSIPRETGESNKNKNHHESRNRPQACLPRQQAKMQAHKWVPLQMKITTIKCKTLGTAKHEVSSLSAKTQCLRKLDTMSSMGLLQMQLWPSKLLFLIIREHSFSIKASIYGPFCFARRVVTKPNLIDMQDRAGQRYHCCDALKQLFGCASYADNVCPTLIPGCSCTLLHVCIADGYFGSSCQCS